MVCSQRKKAMSLARRAVPTRGLISLLADRSYSVPRNVTPGTPAGVGPIVNVPSS
jgi:hypothetical protein